MRQFAKKFTLTKGEIKKFLSIFIISTLVIYNLVILRNLKDSAFLGALGSKAIPRVKIFYVFPASIIFMFAYNFLSKIFNARKLLIIFTSAFGIVFLTYALMPENNIKFLSFLFFMFSEMWNTVVFGTCMWAFFNDICSIEEAKRFYTLVSGIQLGAVAASATGPLYRSLFGNNFDRAILIVVFLNCLGVIATMILGKKHLEIDECSVTVVKSKKKRKKSFFRGLKSVFTSKYLLAILIITFSYNFVIVVTEQIWNESIAQQFVSKADIFVFKSNVTLWTNILTSILAIFLSGGLMKYVGMGGALGIFPMVFGLSTTAYFFLSMTPVTGAMQWILVKMSKYALADPAKQTLFIPCDKEERYESKSFIDIVGARGGKAASSVFNLIFLVPIAQSLKGVQMLKSMAKFSYPILMAITIIWLLATMYASFLFVRYNNSNKEKENE